MKACSFLTRIFWVSEPGLCWIPLPVRSQFCSFTFDEKQSQRCSVQKKGTMCIPSPDIFQLSRKNEKRVKVFWNLFWKSVWLHSHRTGISKSNGSQLVVHLWFWKWQVPRGLSCQAEPILSVNSLCHKESFHVPLSLWEKSTSYFTLSIIHVGHRVTKTKQVEMHLLHSSQSCYCFNLNICPVELKAGRRPLKYICQCGHRSAIIQLLSHVFPIHIMSISIKIILEAVLGTGYQI